MKVFAPKYYKNFKCIASSCTHSCCIGWEIDVDEKSLKTYQTLKGEYADEIYKSIKTKPTPHFKLLKNDKCPHLDEQGICKIILNLGENFLCNICKEHPRFYNLTPLGLEVGLGLSCEEACKIILSSDEYSIFEVIEEDNLPREDFTFNAINERDKILSILSSPTKSYADKLVNIESKYSVSPKILTDGEWKKTIKKLEYLTKSHKKLFLNYSSQTLTPCSVEKFLERALAYFVFRYVIKSQSYQEFQSYLGLCLFLERLLNSLICHTNSFDLQSIIPLAIALSEEIEYSEDNTETIRSQFSLSC